MSAIATAPITERKPETGILNRPTVQAARSHESEALTHDQISKLAYALWEQRGCPYGSPDFDWLEAERQLHESSKHVSR